MTPRQRAAYYSSLNAGGGITTTPDDDPGLLSRILGRDVVTPPSIDAQGNVILAKPAKTGALTGFASRQAAMLNNPLIMQQQQIRSSEKMLKFGEKSERKLKKLEADLREIEKDKDAMRIFEASMGFPPGGYKQFKDKVDKGLALIQDMKNKSLGTKEAQEATNIRTYESLAGVDQKVQGENVPAGAAGLRKQVPGVPNLLVTGAGQGPGTLATPTIKETVDPTTGKTFSRETSPTYIPQPIPAQVTPVPNFKVNPDLRDKALGMTNNPAASVPSGSTNTAPGVSPPTSNVLPQPPNIGALDPASLGALNELLRKMYMTNALSLTGQAPF